jgi:hypothetical protein
VTVPATTANASDPIPDDEDSAVAEVIASDAYAAMDAALVAGGDSDESIRAAMAAAILPMIQAYRAEIEHRADVRGADEAEHYRQLWRDGWLDDPRVPMECSALQAIEFRHMREHRIAELRTKLADVTEQRDRAVALLSQILKESIHG